jgi:hypothetical protein
MCTATGSTRSITFLRWGGTQLASLAQTASSVTVGCASKRCAIVPSPAPGFDVETCRCQASFLGGSPALRAGSGDSSAGTSGAPSAAGASGDPISFPCGSTTCDGRSQICEHIVGGIAPGVDRYDCDSIPTVCLTTIRALAQSQRCVVEERPAARATTAFLACESTCLDPRANDANDPLV